MLGFGSLGLSLANNAIHTNVADYFMTNYSVVTNTCSFSVRGWYITDSHLIYKIQLFGSNKFLNYSMIQIENHHALCQNQNGIKNSSLDKCR